MGRFTADDVMAFTEAAIKAEAEKHGGLYPVNDPVLGQTLPLVYDKRRFRAHASRLRIFPRRDLSRQGRRREAYLVDFWVRPQAGKLAIMDVRVYKAPTKGGR